MNFSLPIHSHAHSAEVGSEIAREAGYFDVAFDSFVSPDMGSFARANRLLH